MGITTSESADEPLDPSVLKKLRALQREGGPDIFDTLIALFFTNAKPMLRDLERGAEADDQQLLRQASHALLSVSANIGAWILANRCRELSQLVQRGPVAGASEWVRTIRDEYRRAEGALLAYSAQRAKAA